MRNDDRWIGVVCELHRKGQHLVVCNKDRYGHAVGWCWKCGEWRRGVQVHKRNPVVKITGDQGEYSTCT